MLKEFLRRIAFVGILFVVIFGIQGRIGCVQRTCGHC